MQPINGVLSCFSQSFHAHRRSRGRRFHSRCTQGFFAWPEAKAFTPDRWLEDGDTVTLGETVWEVYHCPGHTPGHVVFFNREARFAQVGDVLFAGSVGRPDFPRGSFPDLVASITGKLWPLGDDVTFVPGHEQLSTFGRERRTNPFVSDEALAAMRA